MNLHEINEGIQKNRRRQRIGRGKGSGQGKTAGRGHKGQKSNPGYGALPIFQGGTMPLVRRIPKRGFNNKFALTVAVINVGDLDTLFDAGEEVSPESLHERGIIKSRYDELKILGEGELTKKLKISAHRFSQSAKDQIEKSGSELVVLPGKTPVEEKKKRHREAKKQAQKA